MNDRLGVYTIVDRKSEEHPDRKNLWIHIGIAFVNRDGSINVRLNALPVNGSLHIRALNGQGAADGESSDIE